MTGHRRRRSHCRAYQMGSPPRPLPPLEITIGSRSATFTGRKPVVVHCKTHRASGFAPFEPRITKYLVETFLFRLLLDQARAWHNHGQLDAAGNTPALDHRGRGP